MPGSIRFERLFRSRVTGSIRFARSFASRVNRFSALRHAGFNLFHVPASEIVLDFMSDSEPSTLTPQELATTAQADRSFIFNANLRTLESVLEELGISCMSDGYTVFVDAGKFFPRLSWEQFPGYALALALFQAGGIRSCEMGSLTIGRDPVTKENRRADRELTRLVIPRRYCSHDNLRYVTEVFSELIGIRDHINGVQIREPEPEYMRHLTATYRWM